MDTDRTQYGTFRLLLLIASSVLTCVCCVGEKLEPDLRLVRAAQTGDIKAIQALVATDPDPDKTSTSLQGGSSYTPLHAAISAQQWSAAKLLISLGADGVPDKRLPSELIGLVVREGNSDLLEFVLEREKSLGIDGSMKSKAIFSCLESIDKLSVILAHHPNANATLGPYRTPVLLYAIQTHAPTANISLLLSAGADPNAKNVMGQTPIMESIMVGHFGATRILIKAGSDVNIRTAAGQTPLHVAARRADGPLIQLLLKSGANVNAKNGEGKTPFELYRRFNWGTPRYDEVIERLLRFRT